MYKLAGITNRMHTKDSMYVDAADSVVSVMSGVMFGFTDLYRILGLRKSMEVRPWDPGEM